MNAGILELSCITKSWSTGPVSQVPTNSRKRKQKWAICKKAIKAVLCLQSSYCKKSKWVLRISVKRCNQLFGGMTEKWSEKKAWLEFDLYPFKVISSGSTAALSALPLVSHCPLIIFLELLPFDFMMESKPALRTNVISASNSPKLNAEEHHC